MKNLGWITPILQLMVALAWTTLEAQSISTQYWVGQLTVAPNHSFDVALEISTIQQGYKAKFHSVSQNTFDLSVAAIVMDKERISFKIPALVAQFEGTVTTDHSITGQLTQGANKPWAMELHPVASFPFQKPIRVQEPNINPNYDEKEVRFKNPSTSLTIAGTLTLPRNSTNFPTVLLLSGSGPNDRDQTIFGHKNFYVLADLLTQAGIGVLRVDDRGVGESEGNYHTASVLDLADDASAAVDFLAQYPQVNPNNIGLIGHSLGAELAPMVAVRNPKVKFMVMMAGGAKPLSEVILEQTKQIYKDKVSEPALALNTEILHLLFASLQNNTDLTKAKNAFLTGLSPLNPKAAALTEKEREVLELEAPLTLKGFNHFFTPNWKIDLFYDCTNDLKQVKIPTLAMNGTLDTQVIPENLDRIEEILCTQKQPNNTTKRYKGLNHLFQPAVTGLPDEYSTIELTIAVPVVKDIIEWIKEVTNRK